MRRSPAAASARCSRCRSSPRRLSSYWVALVTPVKLGLIQPLVEGLGAEMLVDEQPPAGINDDPMGFDDAVKAAL